MAGLFVRNGLGDASVTDTGSVVLGDPEYPDGTRLEVDSEHNIIRIFIAGKETILIDADGFHVNGDIVYTGSITDDSKWPERKAP